MSVLVVGSVAYDSVTTPSDSRTDAVGGSAMYFSIAASLFTPVSLVAVVGEDFDPAHVQTLERYGVDVSGLHRTQGKTFRWSGEYYSDMNSRSTLDTQLNVFADFAPDLSTQHRSHPYLFLANIDPELQLDVLRQVNGSPKLTALDSMNFWIEGKRDALVEVVSRVDVLFLEDNELRDFAQEQNIVRAANRVLAMGPSAVVAKRGEHGALLFHDDAVFSAPAYPLERVVDPTGAGDSFAAGFVGYLAATGDLSPSGFRRATVLGSTLGSFCVEGFSVDRLLELDRSEIEARFRAFTALTAFPSLAPDESLPRRNAP